METRAPLKIGIAGNGQMGRAIQKLLPELGHELAGILDTRVEAQPAFLSPAHCDVLIEFSTPDAAFTNIKTALNRGIPVVCGTTGWLDHLEEVHRLTHEVKGAFFYASNFNLGVNLFFELNKSLAKLMAPHSADYSLKVEEWHHTKKRDRPSGTAITIAEGLLENDPTLDRWELRDPETDANHNKLPKNTSLPVISYREGTIIGTHRVTFTGTMDDITIEHRAHDRSGFARGALLAAEFLAGKTGIFGMSDLINTSS